MDISTTPQWATLLAAAQPPHLRTLFADDPGRTQRYLTTAGELHIHWSKHRIDDTIVDALMAVA